METPVWTLQDRLRKAREHAGATQSELAERIGVSTNSLNRYEKGQRQPADEFIQALADATGVPVTWFYEQTTTEPPTTPPSEIRLKWNGDSYQVVQQGDNH